MEDRNYKKLIEELKAEGASAKEAEELSLMSKNISNLFNFERSQAVKAKFLEKKINHSLGVAVHKKAFAALFLSILILLGFGTAAVKAQKSEPGELLYPIKQITQNVSEYIKSKTLERQENLVKQKENISSPTPTKSQTEDESDEEGENSQKEDIKKVSLPSPPPVRSSVEKSIEGNNTEESKEKTNDLQDTLDQTNSTVNEVVQPVAETVNDAPNTIEETVNDTVDKIKKLL